MMMSSCQMNSSMMNNVPNTRNTTNQPGNTSAKPVQTAFFQANVAVQANIGPSSQTLSSNDSEAMVKVYNPTGKVGPTSTQQMLTGFSLNQLV